MSASSGPRREPTTWCWFLSILPKSGQNNLYFDSLRWKYHEKESHPGGSTQKLKFLGQPARTQKTFCDFREFFWRGGVPTLERRWGPASLTKISTFSVYPLFNGQPGRQPGSSQNIRALLKSAIPLSSPAYWNSPEIPLHRHDQYMHHYCPEIYDCDHVERWLISTIKSPRSPWLKNTCPRLGAEKPMPYPLVRNWMHIAVTTIAWLILIVIIHQHSSPPPKKKIF